METDQWSSTGIAVPHDAQSDVLSQTFFGRHDVAGQDGAKFDLVRVADVDGDGAADIVTSEEGLGEDVGLGVVWYRNPGT